MIELPNIHSLSDFQRNTKAHIRRLKKSSKPVVLTVNGQAELVVQDAASYQKLLDALETADAAAGIRRCLEQANRDVGRPARQVLEELAARKGIRLSE